MWAVMLGGCMVGPNYHAPSVARPPRFKSQAPSAPAAPIASDWWQLFGDPELTRLITLATASNQTIQQAVASVDQARALARIARSFLAPTIAIDPAFSRQRTSSNRASAFTGARVGQNATISDWVVAVDLSYELDVWGRVRRGLQSARAQVAASADDLATIRLTVLSDVATDFYTLRSLDAQVEILTQTVAAYREQVRVLSVQVKNGLSSPLVLRQAEAQVDSTLAQLRDTVRVRTDQEHALAILCGQPAPSFSVAARPPRESAAPEVPAGLPVMLLTRRPDVAAAEQRVIAANAQIGAATAQLYPTFSLATTAGFESANVTNLVNWQSTVVSLVAGATAPIFQGGRLRANLEAARAQHRQMMAAYVNQVLVAYGDVEDALTDLHALAGIVGNLRDAISASENYLHLAQVQYNTGLVDYLTVVDAERSLLANQLSLAQTLNLQQTASIHLIKALGGGWEQH